MIFLRHPTPNSPKGLCYGRTDLDIGPEGPAQIAQALKITPEITSVIASPALRCRALAEQLAARDDASLQIDPRLWELDFGEWDGVMWADIDHAQSHPWSTDPWNIAPPGGETFGQVYRRVADVLTSTATGTALVCHAGPIRVARMILTGADFDTVFAEPVPYATPIHITSEPD